MKSLILILFFFLSFLFPFLFSVPKRPMCCSIGLHSQGREAATDWVEPETGIVTLLVCKKRHREESFFSRVSCMYCTKGKS